VGGRDNTTSRYARVVRSASAPNVHQFNFHARIPLAANAALRGAAFPSPTQRVYSDI
jgi:hypothetical protein